MGSETAQFTVDMESEADQFTVHIGSEADQVIVDRGSETDQVSGAMGSETDQVTSDMGSETDQVTGDMGSETDHVNLGMGLKTTMVSKSGPTVKRRAKVEKLVGTVKTVQQDGSFGFLKPHKTLPEEFTNRDVYFRPQDFRFQEGDVVTFTLRVKDPTRPSANLVQLHSRKQPLGRQPASQQPTSPKALTVGIIEKLVNEKGWIKVVDNAQSQDSAWLFFNKSWVSCGHMDLMRGDLLAFTIGRDKKRSAHNIKLVECKRRTGDEVARYLTQISKKMSANGEELELHASVLTCDAMWSAIGQCRDWSKEVLLQVITFTELLEQKSYGRKGSFQRGMKALICSGFYDNLKLFVQTHFEQAKEVVRDQVQRFLLRMLDSAPEKSKATLDVIKLTLPSDKNSLDHFLFKSLKILVLKNPNDIADLGWSELPLAPPTSELFQTDKERNAPLREIRVTGAYTTVEEYMDIYFRLLRADCFSGLETGIQNYLNNSLDPRDMYLYTAVSLVGIHFTHHIPGIALALNVTPAQHVPNWDECGNLRNGNLLCLSPSGSFNDAIWATVTERSQKQSKGRVMVWVELSAGCNAMSLASCLSQISHASGRIVMAESPTYYRSYEPVLRALQNIPPEELSLQDELVFMEPPQVVSYAEEMAEIHVPTMMDPSQEAAFRQALQHRVAIIQGPPGTGKTFIGVSIVEALLKCESVKRPIVVLTYKNHALDEFLKVFIETIPDRVVRIGGGSQDEMVTKVRLRTLMVSTKYSNLSRTLWLELEQEKSELQCSLREAIRQVVQSKGWSLQTALGGFTEAQWERLILEYRQICHNTFNVKQRNGILPAWHEAKMDLFDEEQPLRERLRKMPGLVKTFLSAAFKAWTPDIKQVNKMMQPLPNLKNILTSQPKKTKTASPEISELTEGDWVEKERVAADFSRKSRPYTVDIDLSQKEENEDSSIKMAPCAQILVNEMPLAAIHQIENLWALTPDLKMAVIQVLLWHQSRESDSNLEAVHSDYMRLCLQTEEIRNTQKLSILKEKYIVAMTMTGASINQALLMMLQPAVVIVEEAAEVLEPHIMALLGNPALQHLILIGDHKQLSPKVETYDLSRKYHFDISMMERLINNGYPVATLNFQNRMLPEMADLMLDIYPELQSNLEVVTKNKALSFTPSMYFWSHNDPEKAGRSYTNVLEAERVLKLALVFIQMGCSPVQITILAAYQAQVHLLRGMLKKAETDHVKIFKRANEMNVDYVWSNSKQVSIEIQTIDMYQGDENDIIIISLVRSNENGKLGFLQLLNRRCVAQSRARCGMYIVGNDSTFLSAKQSCWAPLIKTLYRKGLAGKQFPLYCPLHKDITDIRATTANDLPLNIICKVQCDALMPCRIHHCKKPCRPLHFHKCKEIVMFVRPCNHPGQRQCWQDEASEHCQLKCTQLMLCGKHICSNMCGSVHSHLQSHCNERVAFIFEKCGHAAKKACREPKDSRRCTQKVVYEFAQCKHKGSRECWRTDEGMCREKCTRTRSCGHPCEAKCGRMCDAEPCLPCLKMAEERMKQQLEAEHLQREAAREEVRKELKKFSEKRSPCLVEIARDGADAAEYYRILDRVMNYIHPERGSFPEVGKIEKVTNCNLQQSFLLAKSKMFDPTHTELMMSIADEDTMRKEIAEGSFTHAGSMTSGRHGKGMYFCMDSAGGAPGTQLPGVPLMLLVCEVLIGKALTARPADEYLNWQLLRRLECDSVFIPRDAPNSAGVQYDEYLFFGQNQALPRYIVHFTMKDIEMIPQLPARHGEGRYLLKPKREYDENDSLDNHFRLAESQFLRLTKELRSDEKIKSVEYFVNDRLTERFDKKKREFQNKYPSETKYTKSLLAFHGTAEGNIEGIMQNNFSMDLCQRGVHGAGIYLSELPDISKGYTHGSNQLILCKVLPGKAYDAGRPHAPLQPGYDSHIVYKKLNVLAWAYVIFNPDQILPLYVITY